MDYKTLEEMSAMDRADERSVQGAKNLKGMDVIKMSTEDVLNAYLGKTKMQDNKDAKKE